MSDRRYRFWGRPLPLAPGDFDLPLTISEFVALWRARAGDEEHLRALVESMGANLDDYGPARPSDTMH
jgi:hypothetical protein